MIQPTSAIDRRRITEQDMFRAVASAQAACRKYWCLAEIEALIGCRELHAGAADRSISATLLATVCARRGWGGIERCLHLPLGQTFPGWFGRIRFSRVT